MDAALFRAPDAVLPPPRDAATLRQHRSDGLAAWQHQREQVPVVEANASREEHLSDARMGEIWDREREHLQVDDAATPLDRGKPLAVVAHRHEWVGAALTKALTAQGWDAVDVYGDAARAVAALVTEQPDLLVCSDRLLGGNGLAVVARAHALAPATRLVVQLDEETRLEQVKAAGAHLVVSHRTPTSSVVALLQDLRASADGNLASV